MGARDSDTGRVCVSVCEPSVHRFQDRVCRCVVPHLQPKGLLDVGRFGGLEVHVQAVLCRGGDESLRHGQREVFAQVLQTGDPPGHGQGRDIAEDNCSGFSSGEIKRSSVSVKPVFKVMVSLVCVGVWVKSSSTFLFCVFYLGLLACGAGLICMI